MLHWAHDRNTCFYKKTREERLGTCFCWNQVSIHLHPLVCWLLFWGFSWSQMWYLGKKVELRRITWWRSQALKAYPVLLWTGPLFYKNELLHSKGVQTSNWTTNMNGNMWEVGTFFHRLTCNQTCLCNQRRSHLLLAFRQNAGLKHFGFTFQTIQQLKRLQMSKIFACKTCQSQGKDLYFFISSVQSSNI